MGSEDSNWTTRLAVRFMPSGSASELITPITNLQPVSDLPKEIVDSIDACNLGISRGNPRHSFTFEVKAVNKAVFRKIATVGIKGARFSVGLATGSGLPDDWVFDSIEWKDCEITNISWSDVTSDGMVPVMKFSAICLDMVIGNNGQSMSTNKVGSASGNLT